MSAPTLPTFGEAWKVRKGRTDAPAAEMPFADEPFALVAEVQPEPPAERAPIIPDNTPDLFSL